MDRKTKFIRSAICAGVRFVRSARPGSFSSLRSVAFTASSIGSCFYSLEKRFLVPQYHKTHFLAYIAKREKHEKMANFGPKPRPNPFGKMSTLRLFELLIFVA